MMDANDLTTQVNELFRHIYNEEKEQIEKLKKKVFPQTENVTIDSYILQAIESSMNIVRDQLRQSIKDQLTHTQNRQRGSGKTAISAPRSKDIFEMNGDNFKNFLDVVNTVIDFYRLFEKSTPSIIEVWHTKLTHVSNLKETLDLQHKQKFYQKIWKDEQIFAVLKSFSST